MRSDLGEVPEARQHKVSRGEPESEKVGRDSNLLRIRLVSGHNDRPALGSTSTVVDVSLSHGVEVVGEVRDGEAGGDEFGQSRRKGEDWEVILGRHQRRTKVEPKLGRTSRNPFDGCER